MGKYTTLWEYVKKKNEPLFKLSFAEIERINGAAIDHSFLNYKKELKEYGYQVGKISMKEKTVIFERLE